MFFRIFMLMNFVIFFAGCSSKRVKSAEGLISNPFAHDVAYEKERHKGISIKRSVGLNSIEITIPDADENTLVRYDLAELGKEVVPDPTLADKEVLKGLSTETKGAKESEKKESRIPQKKQPERSYLLGISKVKELYKRKEYELALVHLEPLLQSYPKDVKLLSLRGTIAQKLEYFQLAEESWRRVLEEDPDNQTIKHALNNLKGGK